MDPDTETIRSAAADPAAVLLNPPPTGVGAPVPAVRGRIVSRRALFERLGCAGRVTQVSRRAPPKLRCVLGAHGRTEAVTQARALGLLAPSPMALRFQGTGINRT
jgi:hypothetical protein